MAVKDKSLNTKRRCLCCEGKQTCQVGVQPRVTFTVNICVKALNALMHHVY